jgi:CRP-like cAMP-binding protein
MEDFIHDYLLQTLPSGKGKVYQKGEIIYHEDTPSYGLYYISSGTVKIYTSDQSGREIILWLASGKDIFGHRYLMDEKNHQESAKAVEESICHFIDGKDFQDKMQLVPELRQIIFQKIGKEIHHYQKRCVELMRKNVRERLASYFYHMTMNHGESTQDGFKIKIQLSREEIASVIGTANETAIRFISEFKELGLIVEKDRYFYIPDKEKIASLSELSRV